MPQNTTPTKKLIYQHLPFPKRTWTSEEDQALTKLVQTYGPHRWSQIAKHMKNRIGKQCRERWFNHLNPTINKQEWSEEEEWRLFLGHRLLGNKWARLTKIIEGRTDNAIKNHWNSIMRKKVGSYEKKLQEQFQKVQGDSQNQNGALKSLLRLESSFQENQSKSQLNAEAPTELEKTKSTQSNGVSFQKILQRLDQNDIINLKRQESYKYDCTNDKTKNKAKMTQKMPEQEGRKFCLKTVTEKQNMCSDVEDMFESQEQNIPLPFLNRVSSLDYRLNILEKSPFKRL